jgi:beta-glucanase (GH16 family)
MKRLPVISAILLSLVLIAYSCSKDSSAPEPDDNNPVTPPAPKLWKFADTPEWVEEFTVDGLPDESKWAYDMGGNGWGNGEAQYYTKQDLKNVNIENGILRIIARKDSFNSNAYTSARLVTKSKADWLYGKFEIKAKLPKGRGTWPAIWMLPTANTYGTWPKSGEIDIMEHVGYDLNRVHFTVHTEAFNHTIGTQVGKNMIINDATEAFHVYKAEWTPYGIRGYFDDTKVFEFSNYGNGYRSWPFDQKFHLLLNIAVGGAWGGAQGIDNTVFPATMEVDYVKMYKFVE